MVPPEDSEKQKRYIIVYENVQHSPLICLANLAPARSLRSRMPKKWADGVREAQAGHIPNGE